MKKIIALIISTLMIISLCACKVDDSKTESVTKNYENLDRFVLQEKIEDGSDWDAIYMDARTGVLYFVHHIYGPNGNSIEWCTVLLGQDGLPLLGTGYERED